MSRVGSPTMRIGHKQIDGAFQVNQHLHSKHHSNDIRSPDMFTNSVKCEFYPRRVEKACMDVKMVCPAICRPCINIDSADGKRR